MIERIAQPGTAKDRETIIGVAWCGQKEYEDEPGRYFVGVDVHPHFAHLEYGKDGICPAAMAALLSRLDSPILRPKQLTTSCREDKADRLAFLTEQGFTQAMRFQDSELDVTAFDPRPFLDKVQQVKALGIELLTIPELRSRFDDWMERIYAMDMEILPDEPGTGEFSPEPIEEYAKMFEHSSFLADGWIVAIDGNLCVGSSSIWDNKADPQKLYTNFTGVRRSHRCKDFVLKVNPQLVWIACNEGQRVRLFLAHRKQDVEAYA